MLEQWFPKSYWDFGTVLKGCRGENSKGAIVIMVRIQRLIHLTGMLCWTPSVSLAVTAHTSYQYWSPPLVSNWSSDWKWAQIAVWSSVQPWGSPGVSLQTLLEYYLLDTWAHTPCLWHHWSILSWTTLLMTVAYFFFLWVFVTHQFGNDWVRAKNEA